MDRDDDIMFDTDEANTDRFRPLTDRDYLADLDDAASLTGEYDA